MLQLPTSVTMRYDDLSFDFIAQCNYHSVPCQGDALYINNEFHNIYSTVKMVIHSVDGSNPTIVTELDIEDELEFWFTLDIFKDSLGIDTGTRCVGTPPEYYTVYRTLLHKLTPKRAKPYLLRENVATFISKVMAGVDGTPLASQQQALVDVLNAEWPPIYYVDSQQTIPFLLVFRNWFAKIAK